MSIPKCHACGRRGRRSEWINVDGCELGRWFLHFCSKRCRVGYLAKIEALIGPANDMPLKPCKPRKP